MKTIEHFVNGKAFSGESKRTAYVFNPATGEQSAEVKLATTGDINKAVESSLLNGYKTSDLISKSEKAYSTDEVGDYIVKFIQDY